LGESTVAQSRGSVAVGRFTYATTAGQFTCGVYSKGDTNQVFIVGWGSGEGARKNVFTVSKSGTGVFSNDCLIGTRSLKAVPVVFRICDTLGYSQTHTLFCAAGHTWADMIAGSENPVVRYVYDDNGTTQYANATLLRVQQGIVQVDSLDSSVNVVSWKDLYTDEYFENAVQATDTPQDGATYYINNE
ncbi:MAG: hypothetical protein IJT18_07780, partial [Oscillospiraceae bacterium]|nr:hypothetical protein [Oscillospiraceae bacterium]